MLSKQESCRRIEYSLWQHSCNFFLYFLVTYNKMYAFGYTVLWVLKNSYSYVIFTTIKTHENFISLSPLSLLLLPLGSQISPYPPRSLHALASTDLSAVTIAFSRTYSQWNHRECNLLRLGFFTQHNALEMHPVAACIKLFFSLLDSIPPHG